MITRIKEKAVTATAMRPRRTGSIGPRLRQRRGIALIMVISLVVLFLLLGASFVIDIGRA